MWISALAYLADTLFDLDRRYCQLKNKQQQKSIAAFSKGAQAIAAKWKDLLRALFTIWL